MTLRTIIFLLALQFLSGPQANAVDGFFNPVFAKGDSWQIKVYPKSFKNQGGYSNDFTIYEYKVRISDGKSNGYQIDVTNESKPDIIIATLYFSDSRSFQKAGISTKVSGKHLTFNIKPDPGTPVVTRHGPVPLDYPVFPLYHKQADEFLSYRKITSKLKSKEIIYQETTRKGDEFTVVCTLNNKQLFYQRWKSGLPFPVYGENINMKYELLSY